MQAVHTARRRGLALALGAAFAAQACAEPAVARRPEAVGEGHFCTVALKGTMFQRTELFFGRSSPQGPVSEAQFQGFLDAVVTPLFPDGLTVVDAKGQWRNSPDAPPQKEDSKLLILLYPYSAEASANVEQIRSRYKEAFAQQSVLRVDERSCVSF
jgi:hypothetical protein